MKRSICTPFTGLMLGLLFFGLSTAQAATLTDEEIVSIVAVANVNEINASKLAKSKASQPKIRQFADKMIRDHRAMDEKAGKLAVRLKLNPTPSEVAETLKAQGSEVMEGLGIAPAGPIFDKEFMNSQVLMHEQVLNLYNSELIPNAKNAKLKALLEQSGRDIEQHLEHARQLHEEITANI